MARLDPFNKLGNAVSTISSELRESGLNIHAVAGYAASATLGIVSGAFKGLGMTEVAQLLDSINYQPSVAFVPIQSESFTMNRQVDIGNTMLVSQANQQKQYITDNAAPRPRTWNISGYITSLMPLAESGFLFKPTLQLQQSLLEAASESRQTVKLRSDNGEMVDVLVQNLSIGSTPKGNNVKVVSVTVQEVKKLQNTMLGDLPLDAASGASVFIKNAIKSGVGTLITGMAVPVGEQLTAPVMNAITNLSKLFK